MIVLFTDFGLHGPYTGQMKAVLHQMAPGIPAIDLFADAPVGNPKASAYLLAAYAEWFAAGTVFLCVVDPGVGGTRPAIIFEADGRWYVGPGNGLFELIQRRATNTRSWDIDWKPSASRPAFTGAISSHRSQPCSRAASRRPAGRARMRRIAGQTGRTICSEIVYIDHYGNAMTGLRAAHAAARCKASRSGSGVAAREDLQRSAAGHGLLVREFERACRNRRQSRPR